MCTVYMFQTVFHTTLSLLLSLSSTNMALRRLMNVPDVQGAPFDMQHKRYGDKIKSECLPPGIQVNVALVARLLAVVRYAEPVQVQT
jgi:hypothetical protein